jgi:hypothetical protein
MPSKTCAIDYSPLRRYSSRQKRVLKIPTGHLGATAVGQLGQNDPDGPGAARQLLLSSWFSSGIGVKSVAVGSLAFNPGDEFLAILVKGELNG